MTRNKSTRTAEGPTRDEDRIRRFPFLLGGSSAFRSQSAAKRLEFLRGAGERGRARRMIAIAPDKIVRHKPFEIGLRLPARKKVAAALARVEVVFPSGTRREIEYSPTRSERDHRQMTLRGFASADAGDLYVSARVYFADGSTGSDARLVSVLSENPDQLVVTPRVWLVSGNAGRVEYDWDTNEFHCRAYATITNGSAVART
jgi:hypothetical protein